MDHKDENVEMEEREIAAQDEFKSSQLGAEPRPSCDARSLPNLGSAVHGLKVPILELALLVGRLRFAAKLTRRPPDFPTALVQGEGGVGWRAVVSSVCSAVWHLLADKLGSMAIRGCADAAL